MNTCILVFGGQVASVILMISLIVYGILNGDVSALVVAIVIFISSSVWLIVFMYNRSSLWRGTVGVATGEFKLSIVNRLMSYPSFISFFVVVMFIGWRMLGAEVGVASWRRRALTVLVAGVIGIIVYVIEALRSWKINVVDDYITLFRYGTVTRISRDSLANPRGTSLQGVVVDGEIVGRRGMTCEPVRCVVDFPLHGWKALHTTPSHTQV